MNIVVFGAAGGIGKHVVTQALARGWSVTAFVRRPEALGVTHPALTVVKGDVHDAAAVSAAVEGKDAALSSLGAPDRKSKVRSVGTENIVAAMKRHGVRRVIAVSAIGVGDSREQARRSSFFFGRIILPLFLSEPFADMDRMESALRQSSLDWTVVRPTGLHDGAAAGEVRVTVDGGVVGARVSRASVAAFMLDELVSVAHLHAMPSIWAA